MFNNFHPLIITEHVVLAYFTHQRLAKPFFEACKVAESLVCEEGLEVLCGGGHIGLFLF
jgi:hypothetical protein